MSDKTDQMEQVLEQVLGLLEARDYEGLRGRPPGRARQ